MLKELFEIELFICIKIDLALNNLQLLICHKIKPNQTKPNFITSNWVITSQKQPGIFVELKMKVDLITVQ